MIAVSPAFAWHNATKSPLAPAKFEQAFCTKDFDVDSTIGGNPPQSSSDTDLSDLLGDSNASAQSADNRAVALDLARRGFAVFPCGADKRPLTAHGFADATTDADQIQALWRTWPDALPALPTGGRNGIAVLDIDRHHADADGFAALAALGFDAASLRSFAVDTPNTGRHIYFGWPEGLRCSARHLPNGLDIRGEGGYVIAPGAVLPDGRSYVARGRLDRSALPDWPAALLAPRRDDFDPSKRLGPDPLPVDWDEVRRALAFISPDCSREDWVRVGMALHAASDGAKNAFELWDAWSAKATEPGKYQSREMRSQWRSFGRGEGVDIGTLFHIAGEYGWTRAPEVGPDDFEDLPALPASSFPAVWGATIQRSSKGDPLPTLTNASIFLASINETEGLGLRYNLMRQWEESMHGEVDDATIGVLRIKIERAGMRRIGKDLTGDAVTQVARRHSYHPVRDYLSALMHDGEKRIDTWLSNYLGSEDTPLTRAIGRAFLIAMVARVEKPGCKHDSMLMLAGDQGIGKSTACSILAGEWFGDKLPSLADNAVEASRYIQGKWLVEAGELEALRKAEAETLKAFISCQDDEGRAPYGRRYRRFPRQTVLVGTTNSTEYLRDTTGNRRYWPVQCGKSLDLDGLERDRDQLFAEARDAFNAGVPWHLSDEMEKQARVAQEAVREQDAWEDVVREYLDGTDFDGNRRDKIKASDCLAFLGIPTAHQGMRESKRMAGVLRALGWQRRHSECGKVWVRP
ncbi:MAG: hypothetical protein F9K19_17265 [Rhizobiaceae bacterium]|nr:MAG: hypothetical protein F9K19_17265 [Rhizobiaceae bacterium]